MLARISILAAALVAALLLAAAPAAAGQRAYVGTVNDGKITGYSSGADGSLAQIGSYTSVCGCGYLALSITPNGRFLVAADPGSSLVQSFQIGGDGQLTLVSTANVGILPLATAITPDGNNVYVSDLALSEVYRLGIDANGQFQGPSVPVPVGAQPGGISISPNGRYLYMSNSGDDTIGAFAIGADGSLTQLGGSPYPAGSDPQGSAINPSGSALYVANCCDDTVSAFPIGSDGALGARTDVSSGGSAPSAVTVRPDGRFLYAFNTVTDDVQTFSVGSDGLPTAAGSPTAAGVTAPIAGAIDASGSHLYMPGAGSDNIAAFSIASGTLGAALPGSPYATGQQPNEQSIALVPEQGPTASFTATSPGPGSPTQFNASASNDADDSIATYAWDFGDGQTTTTASPQVNHTYARTGNYQVTLSVTDSAGCGSSIVFTGQTATCNPNGGTKTSAVTVPPFTLNARAARRQLALRKRFVSVLVTCSASCDVSATSRLTVPRARSWRLPRRTARLAGGVRAKLEIPLTLRQRRAVARALRRGRTSRIRVNVVATDPDTRREARQTIAVRVFR